VVYTPFGEDWCEKKGLMVRVALFEIRIGLCIYNFCSTTFRNFDVYQSRPWNLGEFFILSTNEIRNVLVSLAIFFYCKFSHYRTFYTSKTSLERKKKFRLSRGVAGDAGIAYRALVEICVDDISAVLRAKDLKFRLPFVIWVGLMHLILRILKSLEQTQES
jgi:hypothetical protein